MAWDSYTGVKAAIETWAQRTDLSTAGRCDEFIDTVESDVNKRLRLRTMESSTSGSTVAGTATIALPTDFLETRTFTMTVNSVPRQLRYVTPDVMEGMFNARGVPEIYSFIGGVLTMYPTPDGVYPYVWRHYIKIPALSGSATTNYLTTSAPEMYQYGCLWQCALYLEKPTEIVNRWRELYETAGAALEDSDRRERFQAPELVTDLPTGSGYNIFTDGA